MYAMPMCNDQRSIMWKMLIVNSPMQILRIGWCVSFIVLRRKSSSSSWLEHAPKMFLHRIDSSRCFRLDSWFRNRTFYSHFGSIICNRNRLQTTITVNRSSCLGRSIFFLAQIRKVFLIHSQDFRAGTLATWPKAATWLFGWSFLLGWGQPLFVAQVVGIILSMELEQVSDH